MLEQMGGLYGIGLVLIVAWGCVIAAKLVSSRREKFKPSADFLSFIDSLDDGYYRIPALKTRRGFVNRALLKINGYDNEDEVQAGADDHCVEWYVEDGRGDELHTRLQEDGFVSNFVSQVYRHKTGEPVWVSESARLVRDSAGKMLYCEGLVKELSETIVRLEKAETSAMIAENLRGGLLQMQRSSYGELSIKHFSAGLAAILATNNEDGDLGQDGFFKQMNKSDFARLSLLSEQAARDMKGFTFSFPLATRTGNMLMVIHAWPQAGEAGSCLFNGVILENSKNKHGDLDVENSASQNLRDDEDDAERLMSQFRAAIGTEQLTLHYQMQVDQNSKIIGAEGLLRWTHPELGNVPPDRFIPLAEKSGSITLLTEWLLGQAFSTLKRWENDPNLHDTRLSINISARQFHECSFVDEVEAAMETYGVGAGRLILEMTEHVLTGDLAHVSRVMGSLQELGIGFSLDDFGTGYSSLQHLRKLPFDEVKIDGTFVSDIGKSDRDRTIVKTIISMAQAMNLRTVAEWVETDEQREILVADGCEGFQGYLFGPAMPAAAFEKAASLPIVQPKRSRIENKVMAITG